MPCIQLRSWRLGKQRGSPDSILQASSTALSLLLFLMKKERSSCEGLAGQLNLVNNEKTSANKSGCHGHFPRTGGCLSL